ncbi:hypothetical protein V2O64_07145 [Verrucomicrobiaceae bacterium 227]
MNGRFFLLTAGALLTVSCADFMKIPVIQPKVKKSSRFSEGDATSGLGGMMGGVAGARVGTPDEGFQAGKTPEEVGFLRGKIEEGTIIGGVEVPADDQIVWSTDDPDADIPFDEAFEKAAKPKSPWLESYQEATRESMRTGKPVLMYFTSSKNASSSAAIQSELFAAHDFGDWAKENVVRLRIDIDGGSLERGKLSESTIKRRNYAEKLKKQFHVLGYPTVVVLQPDGSVYTQERGYRRGKKPELWMKLKNAVLTIEHNHLIWKRRMEAKGYRDWTGKNGQVIFAKLARYFKGDIILIEPDGNRVKTSTLGLSKDDRGWIIAEKEKRDQRVKK